MTHHTTPTRSRTLAVLLVVALTTVLVALAGGLTTAASAAPASGATGWIRAGHLSPGTPKADVRLTPFGGGEARTLSGVDFGELSDYERVPTGVYTVSLVRADAPMGAAPMISQNVRVTEGAASTVVATGRGKAVRATVLADDLTPPPAGQAKVRLLSASTDPAKVDASVVDGPTLAQDVATGSSTGYAAVDAQTWSVEVAGSDGTGSITRRVPVEAGGVYTLVALDAPLGGLEVKAVQDSASSTGADGAMPSGGVDTGAGGLAQEPADASVPAGLPAAALLAAAALVGTALVGLRRRATA